MPDGIRVILFDMGGTLRRTVRRSDAERRQRITQLMGLLGVLEDPDAFAARLLDRARAYKAWAEDTEMELNEVELWTRWMAPDFPVDLVISQAVKLNQLWRESHSQYVMRPEVRDVLLTLFRRGYRLGIVSNTTSSVETPQEFEDLHMAGYLEVMILSCEVGRRKPDPRVLLEATQRMQVDPQQCAYLGDLPKRDVQSARAAGFGKTLIISDDLTREEIEDPALMPDSIIRSLPELLDIFTGEGISHPQPARQYNVALSTMWAMRNFVGLEDFFESARRLGFSGIELNHQVTPAMLDGIDLSRYTFSSVHEPCPAAVSTDELKNRDWLISSTDEEKRRLGVEAIAVSIRLAAEQGARGVVIHAGTVVGDWSDEKRLKTMFYAGLAGTPEFESVRQRLAAARAASARPHVDAVKRSLVELLAVAIPLGVKLGLENRYHYQEIPLLDELEEMLLLASPEHLGFWYDIGHAQVMERLGFGAHLAWLERCGKRIIGVHIQDVTGITDHGAPGSGEVDFDRIIPFIPDNALRTFEVRPSNSYEQVQAALELLVKKGLIQCL